MKIIIDAETPDGVILCARAANMAVAGKIKFRNKYKGRDLGFVEYENGYEVSIVKTKRGFSLVGRQR